jgi:RimJ/RimL family protein N-acetyltransferase
MKERVYLTTDRQPFIVRLARPEDVEAVLTLQRAALAESDEYFVRTLEEFDEAQVAAGLDLQSLISECNSLWLVADCDGVIIASLDFHGGEFARTRHVGSFGMTVHRDYRNQGVGSGLVEMLLLWATNHPVIEKLCTNLFTNNTRAIALFSRFGFQTEGRRHREFQIGPGRYYDALMLSKWMK